MWPAVLVLSLVLPIAGRAQQSFGRGFGARIGADLENNNFLLGGHVNLGFLTPGIRFQPNMTVGLGGEDDTFNANAEFQAFFSGGRTFKPYAGGGVGVMTGAGEGGAVLDGVFGVEADVSSTLDWFVEGRLLIGDDLHPRLETGFTVLSF
jgi:hypothetical protein